MDKEIKEFTENIGAKKIQEVIDDILKLLFKRPNYFVIDKSILVVKISRSTNLFWGLGKDILERVDIFSRGTKIANNYFLVLLDSNCSGWIYSKRETLNNIEDKKWKFRETDNNYKINHHTLKGRNRFISCEDFLKKLKEY